MERSTTGTTSKDLIKNNGYFAQQKIHQDDAHGTIILTSMLPYCNL